MLLIHGFPELAYSWRHVMLPLAKAGYHVIAPDQRGYGRSGGTDVTFDDDLAPFSTLNRVRDMMALDQRARPPQRGAGRRARFRIAGGGLVRADAARRVSIGGDDERAVRRRRALPFNTAQLQPRDRPRCSRRRPEAWTKNWRSCRSRASTIRPITRRARRTRTCGTRRRACTISCAPTTT